MAKKKTEEEVVLDGPMSPEDKKRVMRAAIAALKKTHPGIVFDPTEQNKNINWISTGSAKLDMAISDQGGGLPRGRIVEVYGANSCGKTTQFILACANAQRQYPDQPVLYIDVEHSLNIEYAQKLGLDTHPDRWILVQPDSAEEALDILVKMSETGLFSVIVLDSIAGLISEKQWEKDAGEATMGIVAKLLSENIPKVASQAHKTDTLILLVNQLRKSLSQYGAPEVTKGGEAVGYFASLRMKMRKTEVLMNGDDPYGQEIKIVLTKNKVGTPFREVTTNLFFGIGFDTVAETIDLAIKRGVIMQGGAWFTIAHEGLDEGKFQGKNSVVAHFREECEEYDKLKEILRNAD